jgi:hypothetical protein
VARAQGKEYSMSIVIIGGNERMERQYEEICRGYGCTAKVFTKESGALKRKIGSPDMLICFTKTVSHKMMNAARAECRKGGFPMVACHSSSGTALEELLKEKTGARGKA